MTDTELLRSATTEALATLVEELQGLVRSQAQTIAEIVEERNAAQMWNELYLRGERHGR